MDIETFRNYCLQKQGTTESFPFDENTLVFKVLGKMYALTNLSNDAFEVNLKCNPEYAQELREKYPSIKPGYHMNKKHWNTVAFAENLEDKFLVNLIDHSYDLVVKKLPQKLQNTLYHSS